MKFMGYKSVLFGLAVILSGAFSGFAQTTLVNYDFASATAGTPCTATPLTTAAGVTSTFSTGGTGGGACTIPGGTASTAPPAFVPNGSNQSVSLTNFAAGSSNYFQFQLSGVSSYQNYLLFFQSQRSGTGPVNADVQYSTNGTTFTTFQTVNPGNGVFAAFQVDLSSVGAIEGVPTVYFRIVGSGGTGAAGTFRIDNFQVQASQVITAAAISISGRVNLEQGLIPTKALVTLTDSTGNSQSVLTGKFGTFKFKHMVAGETYILKVTAKGYYFAPQVITANEDISGLNLAPLE